MFKKHSIFFLIKLNTKVQIINKKYPITNHVKYYVAKNEKQNSFFQKYNEKIEQVQMINITMALYLFH